MHAMMLLSAIINPVTFTADRTGSFRSRLRINPVTFTADRTGSLRSRLRTNRDRILPIQAHSYYLNGLKVKWLRELIQLFTFPDSHRRCQANRIA